MCDENKPLSITDVRIIKIQNPQTLVVAFARIVLAGQLQLTGLRVCKCANGLFVGYPNSPIKSGEDFRSIYHPITKELRAAIETAVLEEYAKCP